MHISSMGINSISPIESPVLSSLVSLKGSFGIYYNMGVR